MWYRFNHNAKTLEKDEYYNQLGVKNQEDKR